MRIDSRTKISGIRRIDISVSIHAPLMHCVCNTSPLHNIDGVVNNPNSTYPAA